MQSNLTSHINLKIYTIAGRLVYQTSQETPNGRLTWDKKSREGDTVASGVYIYVITNPEGQKKTGKVAIVR